MQKPIKLCRIWSNLRENRPALIQLAFEYEADVHAFWEAPNGPQFLYQVSGFAADPNRVLETFGRLDSWTVREERLDPLAREIYLHDAELQAASDENPGPVEGWGFLIPWSPERRQAVLTAREELIESLKHLAGIWERKTGRRAPAEQWLLQHQLLQAAGYPRVVRKVPENGELENCWIYRAGYEPDLVLSLYRVKDPDATTRVLVATLGHLIQ